MKINKLYEFKINNNKNQITILSFEVLAIILLYDKLAFKILMSAKSCVHEIEHYLSRRSVSLSVFEWTFVLIRKPSASAVKHHNMIHKNEWKNEQQSKHTTYTAMSICRSPDVNTRSEIARGPKKRLFHFAIFHFCPNERLIYVRLFLM